MEEVGIVTSPIRAIVSVRRNSVCRFRMVCLQIVSSSIADNGVHNSVYENRVAYAPYTHAGFRLLTISVEVYFEAIISRRRVLIWARSSLGIGWLSISSV